MSRTESKPRNAVELIVKTTTREQFVDITAQVRSIVEQAGVPSGYCIIFCPHTTAALTVNENADPDVVSDFIMEMAKIVPKDPTFRHSEGNSDAHIKSSLFGSSLHIIVENANLLLSQWQGIYFCEFDGPRPRTVWVKVIEG